MNENITPLLLPLSFAAGEFNSTHDDDAIGSICDAEGMFLATIEETFGDPEAMRVAEYILEACNAYPALTARVKELEEALRPFAKFAESGFDGSVWEVDWSRRADEKVFSINHEHQVQITLGDFRTAIAALNKEPTT